MFNLLPIHQPLAAPYPLPSVLSFPSFLSLPLAVVVATSSNTSVKCRPSSTIAHGWIWKVSHSSSSSPPPQGQGRDQRHHRPGERRVQRVRLCRCASHEAGIFHHALLLSALRDERAACRVISRAWFTRLESCMYCMSGFTKSRCPDCWMQGSPLSSISLLSLSLSLSNCDFLSLPSVGQGHRRTVTVGSRCQKFEA